MRWPRGPCGVREAGGDWPARVCAHTGVVKHSQMELEPVSVVEADSAVGLGGYASVLCVCVCVPERVKQCVCACRSRGTR